jgi:DNA (cytosine-5)-methyltransferase 1
MDARYWGSPALVQRRRRVFLVADFGGERVGEILFKPRRMLKAPAPCGKRAKSGWKMSKRKNPGQKKNRGS